MGGETSFASESPQVRGLESSLEVHHLPHQHCDLTATFLTLLGNSPGSIGIAFISSSGRVIEILVDQYRSRWNVADEKRSLPHDDGNAFWVAFQTRHSRTRSHGHNRLDP